MFYVPVENYEKLEKKLNKIRNKGGIVTLEKGEPILMAVGENGLALPDVQRGTPAWEQSKKHKFYPIEVSGKYEIPGWRFIATVEHTPNGNIIRNITDEKVPERYYTSSPECEHCHRIRDRKDTYLVQNTETGEFKQVGKSCLKEYTDGLDASLAASIAAFVNDPESLFHDDLGWFGSAGKYFSSDRLKRIAYSYVKENGYQKDDVSYMSKFEKAYYDTQNKEIKPATNEEMDAINEWVFNLDTESSDYFRNAFLAWSLEDPEYRHLRLILSLINTYFKQQQQQKAAEMQKKAEGSEDSQFVGNVGDKITFEVASSRVIYQRSFQYGYNRSSVTNVNRIVGTDGNIYIWATNDAFSDGDTITGTVKSHDEYQGEKQTTIIRGKVVGGYKEQFKQLQKEFEKLDKQMQKDFDISADQAKIYYDWTDGQSAEDVDKISKALDKLRAKYAELNDAELQKAFDLDQLVLDEE